MSNDPELLSRPFSKMELSKSSNLAAKALKIKTVGELLARSPAEVLAAGGGNVAVLKEINQSASEMGLVWVAPEVIQTLITSSSDGPLRPELPKKLLDLVRTTYVCTEPLPSVASKLSCGVCAKPLQQIFAIDLATLPKSGLPKQQVALFRCATSSCLLQMKLDGIWQLDVAPKTVTTYPLRVENDYPSVDDVTPLPNEKTAEALIDHKHDVVGMGPRFGGWPGWFHSLKKNWPACKTCQKRLVLLFEQLIAEVEVMEHAFICESGCDAGFAYCTSVE